MEILIILLVLGVVGLVVLGFKFSAEDSKQVKVIEEAKLKKISDLEIEISRKDNEMKKMMDERAKLEEEFFKGKDELDILKKEHAEFLLKIKQTEKAKEEISALKEEIRQKDMMLQSETVARQKLQGEISLKDMEQEKALKACEEEKAKAKSQEKLFEGLKGQYNELEAEIQRVREELLRKESGTSQPMRKDKSLEEEPHALSSKVQPPQAEPPQAEPPKAEPPKAEPPQAEPPQAEPPQAEPPTKNLNSGPISGEKSDTSLEAPSEVSQLNIQKPFNENGVDEIRNKRYNSGEVDGIPGFPPQNSSKVEIKSNKDIPKDTDFLKSNNVSDPVSAGQEIIPEGVFKFTNINKPKLQEPVVEQKKEDELKVPKSPKDAPKEKSKSKKETLIPGFQPKSPHEDHPSTEIK